MPVTFSTYTPGERKVAWPGAGMLLIYYGDPRTKKTTLALSAPKPMGVLPFDRNTLGAIDGYIERGGEGRVYVAKESFYQTENPMASIGVSTEQMIKVYQPVLKRARASYMEMLGDKSIKSVLLDGATYWGDLVGRALAGMAKSDLKGLMMKEPNREMQEWINAATSAGKMLLMTCESKAIWKGNKPSGVDRPDIGEKARYMSQATVECNKSGKGEDARYWGVLRDCHFDITLEGTELEGEEAGFPLLGRVLRAGTKTKDWR